MPENVMPAEPEEESLGETLGRFVKILANRRWWFLATACGMTLAVIAVLWMLPNRYTSKATLVVVAQQVPQRYVVPNSTADLHSMLQAMKQEVLSQTRLLRLINDFGLYQGLKKRLMPEELVALMLSNIDITPLGEHPQEKNFDAFRISFTTEDPYVAQRVTSTLTALFVNEHLRTQEEQATNTTKFLRDQVAEKKARLEQQEERLRTFKMQYIGELPEQQQGNLGILAGLQTQLQNTMNALNHAEQQRVYQQSLIDTLQRQAASQGSPATEPGTGASKPVLSPLEIAQNDLARLENQRTTMLLNKTPAHPDVVRIQREIANAEELVKGLKASAAYRSDEERPSVASRPAAAKSSTESGNNAALAQLHSQLEVNRLEIASLSKEEARLKTTIAQYETRVNRTPIREQQQAGIVRETEALRLEYADLQKKEQESQLATNLEKQQGGQQFRLVDVASLPLVPSSPQRVKWSVIGAAFSVLLGFGLALMIEKRDTSFRSEKELTEHIAAPFVLSVPMLYTRDEGRWLKRKSALEWMAGFAMLLVVVIAEYYVCKSN